MAFGTEGQYIGTHKVYDHSGHIVPNPEHSEGQRPATEVSAAPWLPVQFYERYYENWVVAMHGKIIAMDNDFYVVPAQYGLAGANITYTANDVEAGVIDVRTGVTLLTANIGTFTVAAVTAYMGRTGVALAVSKPIGVAGLTYLQNSGSSYNPTLYRYHNYNMQGLVPVLCDWVLRLPWIPAVATAEAKTWTQSSGNVYAATLTNLPVAKNTTRTPITFSGGLTAQNTFNNEVDALAKVTTQGDWFLDVLTGIIYCWATGNVNGVSVTYYHYGAAPTTVSRYACAVGNLSGGEFLISDANSNFQPAVGTETFADIVGQVVGRVVYPYDNLDRVKTAYSPAIQTDATGALPGSLGQLDQMPGSATGGVTDAIHYAGGANTELIINLVSR